MGKPNFRGPPYKGEINPLTGKPYSTNPRAHGARWKAWYNKKTPDGRKQGEVWEEWTKTEEYKKSKEYINKKKEAEDRPRHTAQDQGEAVERAKEQMKIPTMKEQIERDKTKINPEDDWQTSPECDQEGGGWQDEKPLKDLNPRRSNITSTINNALKISTTSASVRLLSSINLITSLQTLLLLNIEPSPITTGATKMLPFNESSPSFLLLL